jgi:hypothetical protein
MTDRGHGPDDSGTPTKVDAWRRENGGAKVMEYGTASGGWVIQLPDYTRLYVHLCDDCGRLIVVRRDIKQNKRGPTMTGAWPRFCTSCSAEKARQHNRKGTERKRKWREAQRAFQREQFNGSPPRGYSVR